MSSNSNNVIKINSVEEFIAAAKEAKENNVQAFWDIPFDIMKEIMEGDALDIVYGN